MIYILIGKDFYKIYKESEKLQLLTAYSKNRQAKIYTKKLTLKGK